MLNMGTFCKILATKLVILIERMYGCIAIVLNFSNNLHQQYITSILEVNHKSIPLHMGHVIISTWMFKGNRQLKNWISLSHHNDHCNFLLSPTCLENLSHNTRAACSVNEIAYSANVWSIWLIISLNEGIDTCFITQRSIQNPMGLLLDT